jgi:hypothetical protein
MIKQLFFTAVLLAPSIAYAGNPSADLSVQIVPPPPPNPVVPPQAAAAGFTTPVVQADFTVPGNFWSNTANYITNCGAPNSVSGQPSTWHFTYVQWSVGTKLPCSRTAITTDPTFGGQVLNEQMQIGDFGTQGVALEFPAVVNQLGTWLPNGYYIKIVARCDAGCVQNSGGVQGHVAFWSHTVNYSDASTVDNDDWETFLNLPRFYYCGQINEWPGPKGDYSVPYFPNGTICSAQGTPDFTQYHTIEALYTSDGSTKTEQCVWLDGTLLKCSGGSFVHSTSYAEKDRAWDSAIATYGGNPNFDENLYIKSIAIFSCANAGKSTCPGTVVDHWPFP